MQNLRIATLLLFWLTVDDDQLPALDERLDVRVDDMARYGLRYAITQFYDARYNKYKRTRSPTTAAVLLRALVLGARVASCHLTDDDSGTSSTMSIATAVSRLRLATAAPSNTLAGPSTSNASPTVAVDARQQKKKKSARTLALEAVVEQLKQQNKLLVVAVDALALRVAKLERDGIRLQKIAVGSTRRAQLRANIDANGPLKCAGESTDWRRNCTSATTTEERRF